MGGGVAVRRKSSSDIEVGFFPTIITPSVKSAGAKMALESLEVIVIQYQNLLVAWFKSSINM